MISSKIAFFLTAGFIISSARDPVGISLIDKLCLLISSTLDSRSRFLSSSVITDDAPKSNKDWSGELAFSTFVVREVLLVTSPGIEDNELIGVPGVLLVVMTVASRGTGAAVLSTVAGLVAGAEVIGGEVGAGVPGFSGVRGMMPLQNNFLPNLSF